MATTSNRHPHEVRSAPTRAAALARGALPPGA